MATEIQEERIRHLNEKEVREDGAGQDNVDSYLEELVVRRELSISFQIYKTPRAEIPHVANRQLSRSAP